MDGTSSVMRPAGRLAYERKVVSINELSPQPNDAISGLDSSRTNLSWILIENLHRP